MCATRVGTAAAKQPNGTLHDRYTYDSPLRMAYDLIRFEALLARLSGSEIEPPTLANRYDLPNFTAGKMRGINRHLYTPRSRAAARQSASGSETERQ